MSKFKRNQEENEGEFVPLKKEKKDHGDYQKNLTWFETWIALRVLPGRMRCAANDSQNLKKSIVVMGYSFPPTFPRGNVSFVVNIHQKHEDFKSEFISNFNGYYNYSDKTNKEINK